MRTHWEEIYNFKTDRFTVVCEIAPEEFSPQDCFDPHELKDVIEDIENGKCEWFMCRVRVLMDHKFEIGTDYLGGCAYYNVSEFVGDRYFRDLIRSAIKEARVYLKKYFAPYQRAA